MLISRKTNELSKNQDKVSSQSNSCARHVILPDTVHEADTQEDSFLAEDEDGTDVLMIAPSGEDF